MNRLHRLFQGHFTPQSLRMYVAVEALFFWGTIFLCWQQFPAENKFSILTHTFSYLGSFNPDRNPAAWWLFTVAMVGWGLLSLPLLRYIARHLRSASPKPPEKAIALLYMGVVGIILVGLCPDAREPFFGTAIRWTDLHYIGAAVLVLGTTIGIPWTAVLVYHTAKNPQGDEKTRRAYQRAQWPHTIYLIISGVALYFLLRWIFVYEKIKAAADAAGLEIGSPWQEAMNTPYSFPLWDNVYVQTLFIYFIWFALTLPPNNTNRD